MAEATTQKKPAPEVREHKPDPETDAPPTPEASPAINAPNAAYYDPPGNWSDPPELAEGENEIEGSLAKPLEEDAKEEREKIRKEEKERVKKAIEANAKKAETRTAWEEKQAAKRRGAS